MPADIVWLDQALDDLDSVLNHIANDSPKAALRYGADLEKSSEIGRFSNVGPRLQRSLPLLGFPKPPCLPSVRRSGKHCIYYHDR
jgi:plasmid stabilization system protein ParE